MPPFLFEVLMIYITCFTVIALTAIAFDSFNSAK